MYIQLEYQTGMVNPESKLMYDNLNGKIETWSDMFYLLLVKVSAPGLLIISFSVSYYLYFTTDLGSDAFLLPFHLWYVTNTIRIKFSYSISLEVISRVKIILLPRTINMTLSGHFASFHKKFIKFLKHIWIFELLPKFWVSIDFCRSKFEFH